MTVLDLINGAARLIGVQAAGEVMSADESANALVSLNDMIESWSTQNLLIYNKTPEIFSLVANQQSYTWGTGGDFNSARPMRIENINYRQVSGSTTLELPIEILNQDQWANISVKTITSNLPTKVWTVFSDPLATLYFWPIPSIAATIDVWSWKALTSYSSLSTVLTLPPGYTRALRYNLAVELAPEYGRQVDPIVEAKAESSIESLKRMNAQINYLGTDKGLLSKKSTWNWYTGE